MKNLKITFVYLTIIVSLPVGWTNAQDWPQFLGPDRNSTSPQKGLLRSWPDSGPEVLWSKDLGIGYGGPVVKNGEVFLLDRDDDTGDVMRCFDLRTGEELWKYGYESPGTLPSPGSRSVPVVDDRHVYSVGGNGDLYCFDIKTHQPVWKKNIWKDFGGDNVPMWGISQCPLIYGDLLITASQAPQAGVVAYDKHTGALVWQTPNLGNIAYVSPKVIKLHGEDQIVYITSKTNGYTHGNDPVTNGNVTGIDPRSGKTLWQYADWGCVISIPCAVDAGENKLLITGGYDQGTTMLQINKNADGAFEAAVVFTTLEFEEQTKPPLLYNGYFYGMFGTNSKREGLVCMDMNGQIMWKTRRSPNFDKGSMILADGLILATDGMKSLYLIEPDPSAFKTVSKADIFEGGSQNWAPIALADGKLLIRDQKKMLCIKVAE